MDFQNKNENESNSKEKRIKGIGRNDPFRFFPPSFQLVHRKF